MDRNCGYNLRLDSDGKCIVSKETREKLRIANKRRYNNPDERKRTSDRVKKARKEHADIFAKSYEKVAKTRRKYRIAKCNVDGEIIKVYEIIGDILKENPTYYKQAIKGCCQGTKKTYKGFRWHYCDINSNDLVLKGIFKKL